MLKLIIEIIIQIILISPLIMLSYNKHDKKWLYLLLFVLYYFFYMSLLFLPGLFSGLRLIDSSDHWNWSGKIYAIIGSFLFYLPIRKMFGNHTYLTFRQNNSTKFQFYITIIVFLLTIGLAFLYVKMSDERLAYFSFQFTMPGLDEEVAFRGIMLGLLSNSLKPKFFIGSINLGNPSLLITSILFGLVHSFHIDNNWVLYQNWFEFFNSFLVGLFLGWMTIKSGSLLMAILIHNLINTLPKLIFWL